MNGCDLFQIGLEPCGVRTFVEMKCQHQVYAQNENTVNNTELALVLVLQHQVQTHG